MAINEATPEAARARRWHCIAKARSAALQRYSKRMQTMSGVARNIFLSADTVTLLMAPTRILFQGVASSALARNAVVCGFITQCDAAYKVNHVVFLRKAFTVPEGGACSSISSTRGDVPRVL